jgi:hypothetical protein
MKRLFLIGTLVLVILPVILAAGCTFPTTSSPTSTPSSQNVSQYLTTMMQERNFTMMTPFSFQPSPQTGMAVYNGTASDNNGTYAVSVQAWNNAQTAQAQFVALKTMFMGQGYAVVQENATAWLGFNANARTGAAIEYGTSPLVPYYTMVITGSAVGQTPFQQAMWQHMWDVVHSQNGNGGGMGVYMGVGMNATMRNAMQQEMQEHVGSGLSPGMTGKLA